MRVVRRAVILALLVIGLAAPSTWASAETPAYLGAQGRFTLDGQRLADRASVAVNVANGNLVVAASDVRIAGRGLGLSIGRTYNGRGGGVVRTAGRDWVVALGADNTLATETDGDRTWRGPTGEEYRFDLRTDGTFKTPAGANATLTVNTNGTASLTEHRSGSVLSFSSASPGKLTRVEDRNGNHVDYAYGTNGVSSITDTQGRSITFTYWSSGDLKTIGDPGGRTWGYAYDASRRLTSYTDPEGEVWGYDYDGSGRLDEITDPRANKTLIGYDTTDRVTSVTRRVDGTTTNDVTTTYAYSAASSPCSTSLAGKTVVTDPRGKATTYCVDGDRQVKKALDALGRQTSRTYTPNGDVSDFEEFGGTGAAAPTTYSFDTSSTATTDATNNPLGGTMGAGESFSFTYHSSGSDPLAKFRVASFTDAQGTDTFYGYDTRGNLTSVKDDQGAPFNQATLTYNGDGTIATATDGLGHQTTYAYDSMGNLASVTPPATLGPGSPFGATTFTHDSLGRVATVTDGRGAARRFTYDKLDRITKVELGDPLGHQQVDYGYDPNGNLLSQDWNGGLELGLEYDELNRRIEDTLPVGRWNAYGYDKASNLTEIADQSQTVTYGYDDVDRVTSIAAPNAGDTATDTITVAYDDTGTPRTRTLTLPNGATERYETDRSGKLTKVVSKKSDGTVLRSRSYGFSDGPAERQLVQSVTDEHQFTTSYTYNDTGSGDTGRLVKAVTRDSANRVVSQYDYVYDKAGNRKTRQVVGTLAGHETRIGPDVNALAGGRAEAFKTTAQSSGATASLTLYLDATSTASSVQVGLYSDASGHPGTLLAQATIGSPSNGAWNRVNLTGASVTEGTTYWIAVLRPAGATGLLQFRSTAGTGTGSETSSSSTLASLPGSWATGTTYTDGPIAAYLTSSTQTSSFAYNNANQLCWSITGSSTAGCDTPPTGATQFSYDEAGNQLTGDRTITYDPELNQTETITTADPNNPLELGYLGADQPQIFEADGEIQQQNLLGLGVEGDQRITRDPDTGTALSITENADKRYLLHDAQDSTLALLSPGQYVKHTYTYDPDGNATVTNTAHGPGTDIQWNGAHNIQNSGIYHFGHRLYNPTTARWTQPDPISQPADLRQANLYAYAGGDPINNVDPTGLLIFDDIYETARNAVRDAGKFAAKRFTPVCYVYKSTQSGDTNSVRDDVGDLVRCTPPGFLFDAAD